MKQLEHVTTALNQLEQKLYRQLRDFYSPEHCPDLKCLKARMEGEDLWLLNFSTQAGADLRTVCCNGLREDGVGYPELLWAKSVGSQIPPLVLSSISEELAKLSAAATQEASKGIGGDHNFPSQQRSQAAGGSTGTTPPNASAKNLTIGGCVLGAGLTIAGIAVHTAAIHSLLIALGLVALTGSAVGLILTNRINESTDSSASRSTPAASPKAPLHPDQSAQIRQLLEVQLQRCEEVLHGWLSSVCSLITSAAGEEDES